MKTIRKLVVAFLAIMFVVNNSSYGQCNSSISLPTNQTINTNGCFSLDDYRYPVGTDPSSVRVNIKVDLAKVNLTNVHIGTNDITTPTWGVLPTGYSMPNGYDIYSSYIKPLIPGPYYVVGNQSFISATIQFIATPQIQFLSGNGTIVKDWSYIVKGQTINAPPGATQAEVRLPEWFTYTGNNLGSNALILNVVTLIGTGNQSLYTLTQSGNYECQMMDGYSPNGVNAVDFQLMFPVEQFTITTQSNPSNGGTTSGGGQYAQGTSCTVNATANLGYQFTNWTENSTVVSTSANYTFTVSGSRTLVANFAIKEYTLTVNNGTGSGSYAAGASVPIVANDAPNGKTFDQWTGDVSNVADVNAASTTFTMGSTNATITATYKDIPVITYTLTVNNGTGSGSYAAGASVPITANPPADGKMFDRWTGDISNVADINAASTTYTMGSTNATITATYKDIPVTTYTLTVNNGTGSGSYATGTQVPIVANNAPNGKTFDQWTGDVSGVADINAASTTYTMGSTNATITATYKDVQRSHKYLAYSITNNTVNVQIVGAEPGETYTLTVGIEELGKENIPVQVTHKGTQQWEFPINTNKMHHLRAQYGTTILEAWIQKQ